jgi:thioredoxin 2
MSDSRHIVCPHCSAINRVPAERAAEAAKCGSCKQKLFASAPLDVDRAKFERQIGRNSIPVLVDVWAPWCGPCRMMAPAFAEAARTLEPDMRLVKLNSEDEPEVAGRLGIQGIPTMLLFAGGREIARVSGAMSASAIIAWARERTAGLR